MQYRTTIATAASLLLTLVATCLAANSKPEIRSLKLPEGFKVSVYCDDVPGARSLALSPEGTLYVGSIGPNTVYALPDKNKDGKVDQVYKIATDLNRPNGIAFRNGSLYVAEIHRVLRFDKIESRLSNPPAPEVVNNDLPTDEWHGYKYIGFGPDGWLYVPVGAPCNVCEKVDKRYATIMRMKPDGSESEVYASGVRNTVGFDWHPRTGNLWFTDNGRDYLGDNLPPDELNHVTVKGQHFGFPYRYGNNVPDPQFGYKKPGGKFVPPAMPLGPHVAALGMRFYTGKMFPEKYRGRIFICEHGSWNRSTKIGYRITMVSFTSGKPDKYQTFMTGFLTDKEAWGRPVDLCLMPDGSMLVSDDRAGAIYRISCEGN